MKQKDFFDLAREMEKSCGDWENTKGMSEEALNRILLEAERREGKREPERGQKIKPFRLKKRYLLVLAAALSMVFGTGVVGDRAWVSDSTDLERETEVTTKVDTDEKDDILLEEEEIYREIGEKLGIVPMWLGYIPEGMKLDSYLIMESTGWAYLNYIYDDNLICIQMARKSQETSSNVQWDGDSRKIENISNLYGLSENIIAYCTDEENSNFIANVSYGNGFYVILGCFMDENEFLEILNEIYFKSV